jgi:hypothetical protein
VPTVILPFYLSVAPFCTVVPAAIVPNAELFLISKIPLEITVEPVYVLAPESTKIPIPAFVRLVPAPLTTPDIVKLSLTVIEGVSPPKNKGQEIVAVPEMFVIGKLLFIVNVPPPATNEEFVSISVIFRHDPATFMVTIIPVLIVISSDRVGKGCPPHVIGSFQLPLTLAIREPANTSFAVTKRIKNIIMNEILFIRFRFGIVNALIALPATGGARKILFESGCGRIISV